MLINRRKMLKSFPGIALISSGLLRDSTSIRSSERKILIEAHRGNSFYAPENTLIAIEQAIQLGVDRIEIDLEFSGDGKLVVIHDNTVDRTTNGKGSVCDMDYTSIRKLDAGSWKGKKFAGAYVPLLEEALELCKGKCMLNIDLKNEKAVTGMVKLIRKMQMEDEVVITGKIPLCSKDIRDFTSALTMFYESTPEFSEILVTGNHLDAARLAIQEARKYSLPGFLFHWNWIDSEIVYMCHLHGLAVNVYDVNTEASLKSMLDAGVDAVMTDDPERIQKSVNLK